MYIVVSDYANEKVDIYKSVSFDKAFQSRSDAIDFAARSYQSFVDNMPSDEAARYENATRINTDSYVDFCECALYPYPEYAIGAAVDNGEDNHMYYMVFKVEE